MASPQIQQQQPQQGQPAPDPQQILMMQQQAQQQQMDQAAMAKVFDIGVGEYDIVIDMEQSFKTRQAQEAAWMLGIVQAEPQIMAIAGDIIVGAQQSPGSKLLAERLKKALPPNLQDDADPAATSMKLQSQLQQAMQQHDLLAQELNKAHDIIQQKQIEQQGKMAVEQLHAETQITVAEITTKAQNEKFRIQLEHDAYMAFHDAGHEAGMQAEDHAQQADQQQAQAAQAQQSQQTDIQAQQNATAQNPTQGGAQ